jgi:hypothetical protein
VTVGRRQRWPIATVVATNECYTLSCTLDRVARTAIHLALHTIANYVPLQLTLLNLSRLLVLRGVSAMAAP